MPLSSGDGRGYCPEGRKSLRGRLGQKPRLQAGACHTRSETFGVAQGPPKHYIHTVNAVLSVPRTCVVRRTGAFISCPP
jgi:hypothetical protein